MEMRGFGLMGSPLVQQSDFVCLVVAEATVFAPELPFSFLHEQSCLMNKNLCVKKLFNQHFRKEVLIFYIKLPSPVPFVNKPTQSFKLIQQFEQAQKFSYNLSLTIEFWSNLCRIFQLLETLPSNHPLCLLYHFSCTNKWHNHQNLPIFFIFSPFTITI